MKLNLIDLKQEIVALLSKVAVDTQRYIPATRQTAAELIHLLESGTVVLAEPKAATESNETLVNRIADLERKLSSAHSQLDNALEENQKLLQAKAELESDVRRLVFEPATGLTVFEGRLTEFVGDADNGRTVVVKQNGKLRTMVKSSWYNPAARAVSVTEAARMLVERIDAANQFISVHLPTFDKSDTEVLREVIGHLDNADIVLLLNALRAKDGEK